MKNSNNTLRGSFITTVKKLRKNQDNRYILTLELNLNEKCSTIKIDIHDSLLETLGRSKIDNYLISKIESNLPNTIQVHNIQGYWKIQDESYILSYAISKSL